MSRVMLISDTHFGHKNITRFRKQFSSSEEHDEILIDNILRAVNKRDTLWLLGDCFFTVESFYATLPQLSAKAAYVNWILGNHDTQSTFQQDLLAAALREGMVQRMGSLFSTKGFWLSHHPIHPAELRGRVNIHGHVHSATIRDKNYINVCCENINYTPVNMQMLRTNPRSVLNDYA